jgi:hypothetical protein
VPSEGAARSNGNGGVVSTKNDQLLLSVVAPAASRAVTRQVYGPAASVSAAAAGIV